MIGVPVDRKKKLNDLSFDFYPNKFTNE